MSVEDRSTDRALRRPRTRGRSQDPATGGLPDSSAPARSAYTSSSTESSPYAAYAGRTPEPADERPARPSAGDRGLPTTGSLALFGDAAAAVSPPAATPTRGTDLPSRRSRREALTGELAVGAAREEVLEAPTRRSRRAPAEAPAAPPARERRGRSGADAPDAVPTRRGRRGSSVVVRERATPAGGLRLTTGGRRRVRVKLAGAVAAATILAGGGFVVASSSNAESPATREGFAPQVVGNWVNDATLDETRRVDQYAQADVSGLIDGRHNAGFLLRYGGRSSWVLAAVSGTGWIVQGAGEDAVQGVFDHASAGVFRAEITGDTVRLLWNNDLVTTQQVSGSYPGKAIVPTVWQASQTVRMSNLVSSSLSTPTRTTRSLDSGLGTTTHSSSSSSSPVTPTESPSASPSPSASESTSESSSKKAPAAARPRGFMGWYSGASGDSMAAGGFDSWRATKATIAGTWDDSASAQQELYSICGGQYKSWDRALDLAMGGIYQGSGESWSAAASGAYDDRWTKVFTTMKSCWGSRDPNKLFVRFAHEMNLSGSDWKVRPGEEDDFAKAFTRVSDIRYKVFPGVQLVFCPNDGTSGGLGDIRKMWPGRDSQGRLVANVYCVDSYNMYPHVTSTSEFEKKINSTQDDGSPLGIEKHRQYAAKLGVPFAIGEWSNNGNPGDADGGGESPEYVKDFYEWAAKHGGDVNNPKPGQLIYEVQFNLWNQYQLWPSTMQPETAAAYKALPWGRIT